MEKAKTPSFIIFLALDTKPYSKEFLEKINDLENRIREFEKLIELEDFDIFITCPYCGMEFQTDYDETIDEIPCPSCGESIDIDWSDNEN